MGQDFRRVVTGYDKFASVTGYDTQFAPDEALEIHISGGPGELCGIYVFGNNVDNTVFDNVIMNVFADNVICIEGYLYNIFYGYFNEDILTPVSFLNCITSTLTTGYLVCKIPFLSTATVLFKNTTSATFYMFSRVDYYVGH